MYTEILSHIRTKADVWQLEDEVDLLLDHLYKGKAGDFDLALKKDVRSWLSELLVSAFTKPEIKKDDYIRGLKEAIGTLRELKLTLAFEPTQNSIEKIHDWVRKNVGENIILDITFNPTIFAGAIVIFEGEYRDLSLRNKFKEQFGQNRERIFEILGK
mgnify:CR=1 FL=1